jgi:integrase
MITVTRTKDSIYAATIEAAAYGRLCRRPHVVHLGPTAVAILRARDRSERPLVFGTGHGGFSGWSHSKARLDAKLVETGPWVPWVIHDLRRAAATHMNEIGVAPHIVEAVLGHVSGSRGGIAGVYNLAAYEPGKRAAMLRWDKHLWQRSRAAIPASPLSSGHDSDPD